MALPQHQVTTVSTPVIMLPGHTSQMPVSLTVECWDKAFHNVKVISNEDTQKCPFRIEGAKFGTSWSLKRRIFGGPSGEHLFDLRHHPVDIKNSWVVEAAEDGRQLATLVHDKQLTKQHSNINAKVRADTSGAQLDVFMRHRDGLEDAVVVDIMVGNQVFANIEKVSLERTKFTMVGMTLMPQSPEGSQPRSVWRVTAAAGADLSLVMVMTLCRAEMAHVWSQ